MKPYYHDNLRMIFNKSCTDMSELLDESVQMVVTSPPYWGLRKYKGDQIISVWNCAYGLEPLPEMYVAHTIEILREIKRVLRQDGVCFWNIGDSYAGSGQGKGCNHGKAVFRDDDISVPNWKNIDIKPKDLCLIPFRVAIAAQEDGWYVRSVIIWNKPNAMPESVKDRPTESHEYILLLTKSENYYWNQDAVRENLTESSISRLSQNIEKQTGSYRVQDKTNGPMKAVSSWHGSKFTNSRDIEVYGNVGMGERIELPGRNVRSVWSFPTHPYKEAHFATFPEELPERCIKAGSKEGDIVLDPFTGSGTTLFVAARLGRKSVGYELSQEYCDLIINRNRQMAFS